MEFLEQFDIPLLGIKEGIHSFNFDINNKFFDAFEYSIIKQGNVNLKLIVDKKSAHYTFEFKYSGHLTLECDYCLKPFNFPVSFEDTLILKLTDDERDFQSNIDEIKYIMRNEAHYNIAKDIYDSLTLAVPMQKRCVDNECDEEVTKFLNKKTKPGSDNSIDPRWEKLAKFKK